MAWQDFISPLFEKVALELLLVDDRYFLIPSAAVLASAEPQQLQVSWS